MLEENIKLRDEMVAIISTMHPAMIDIFYEVVNNIRGAVEDYGCLSEAALNLVLLEKMIEKDQREQK